jgi:hypothetical protein
VVDEVEIVEERKLKNSMKLCDVCESSQATRRMLTKLNGEPFELYHLCDKANCLQALRELV